MSASTLAEFKQALHSEMQQAALSLLPKYFEMLSFSQDADELRKMKETVEGAARDVESSVSTAASDFEKDWQDATSTAQTALPSPPAFPAYKHPKKKWRVKQGAMPNWYKARAGVRTKALSGAARVARYRPKV